MCCMGGEGRMGKDSAGTIAFGLKNVQWPPGMARKW